MKLAPDAYERVKKMRQEVPNIAPAAARITDYPRLPEAPLDTCAQPPPEQSGPCGAPRDEDVAFSCPHVEPKLPCCDPDERDRKQSASGTGK